MSRKKLAVACISLALLTCGPVFAQPADPGPQFLVPLILSDEGRVTGIAISNFGDSPASVRFQAMAPTGMDLWAPRNWAENGDRGPLGPGEQRALLIHELFTLPLGETFAGWLKVESENPDLRVVYQLVSHSADQLDGANAFHRPLRQLVFPWVVEGTGHYQGADAHTQISLVNPGDEPVTVLISWHSADDAPVLSTQERIEPGGMLFRSTREWFPGLSGRGALVAAVPEVEPTARLLGCQVVELTHSDRRSLLILNGLEAEPGGLRLYSAQAATGNGISTDLTLFNPGFTDVNLELTVSAEAGEVVAGPVQWTVPAGRLRQADIGDLFGLEAPLIGTLTLEADRAGLIGATVFGNAAVGYAAGLPLTVEQHGGVVFPHAAYLRGGDSLPGFFTGIALHAPDGTEATGEIRALVPQGSTSGSAPFALTAGGRTSRLLSELVDLPEQAAGYVRIQVDSGAPVVAQELFGESSLRMLSAVPAFGEPSADPSRFPLSPYIVVDQFGYLPDSEKVAVIRDPQVGFDAAESFQPGPDYVVVDAVSGEAVFSASPAVWGGGQVDASSGDRAWWFDFSSVTREGDFYVVDQENRVRSARFTVSGEVYREVLRQAVRTFFFQRAGQEKPAQFAGEAWADGPSHLGALQDSQARLYSRPHDASTERDLRGGWFDAGDYNKYTSWTADYVIELLRTWRERPGVFGDDFGIPESGNGIPDLLDEVRWGMDWLKRMQNPDGSVLSIVGLSHASPPSRAAGPSRYGSPNTSATRAVAAAFALGSTVYRLAGGALAGEADDLLERARRSWTWAEANPNVIFRNNDQASGSAGLGAGQQETDDYGRLIRRLTAACFLFEATGEPGFRDVVDSLYRNVNMMQWRYVFPFQVEAQEMLLHYSRLPGAHPATAGEIRSIYLNSLIGSDDNLGGHRRQADPYLAHLKDYTWGSNSVKCRQGAMFYAVKTYGLDPKLEAEATRAAKRYIHYLHGVNPLGLVYLSNMYGWGAERSVNEFYHSWFADGSPLWDRVGPSRFGPPPGFLVGGPNPSYNWDGCCPGNCGSPANNAKCQAEPIAPPKGQPKQKSYKDFNTSWPLNSWSVTENSNGYQVWYIRLLSKFVPEAVE